MENSCYASKTSLPESCFNKVDDAIEDYLMAEDDVRKSMIRLDVYFKSMTTSKVTEERKYSVNANQKLLTLN